VHNQHHQKHTRKQDDGGEYISEQVCHCHPWNLVWLYNRLLI